MGAAGRLVDGGVFVGGAGEVDGGVGMGARCAEDAGLSREGAGVVGVVRGGAGVRGGVASGGASLDGLPAFQDDGFQSWPRLHSWGFHSLGLQPPGSSGEATMPPSISWWAQVYPPPDDVRGLSVIDSTFT